MGAVEMMPTVLANDAEAWALRISARWRQSIESIIETGQLLHDAKAALPHGEFGAMIADALPFGARTAQMLMAVASDKRLSNPKHVSLLPPSWGTLHALTSLSDDEFTRGIEEKIIRPDMERKDVDNLRPQRERPEKDATQLREGVDAWIADQASSSDAESPDAPAAHMAGRIHPAGDLDYSPTPPWATRALVERVLRHAGREGHCKFQRAWEPACGEGHMAEVLREYFREVFASDIHARCGYPDKTGDFLASDLRVVDGAFDWIITNPPFGENVLPSAEAAE
jgi:hypothetical protein